MSEVYDYYMYVHPYQGLRCRMVTKPSKGWTYVVAIEPFGSKRETGEEVILSCNRNQFKRTMPKHWRQRRKDRGDV